MKELLRQYAAYNAWANQQLTDRVLKLPEEQQTRELPGSFSSLHLTILHMWDAGSTWWQRLKLCEAVVLPSTQFSSGTREAVAGLQQLDKQWEEWVANASLAILEHVVAYRNSRKEQFKDPIWQLVMQLCNHCTYHRGQMVTMLRTLGADKIPGTDFIAWNRSRR